MGQAKRRAPTAPRPPTRPVATPPLVGPMTLPDGRVVVAEALLHLPDGTSVAGHASFMAIHGALLQLLAAVAQQNEAILARLGDPRAQAALAARERAALVVPDRALVVPPAS
jgi:hypothetical protein